MNGMLLIALGAGCDVGAGHGPDLSLQDLPATITLAVGETRNVGGLAVRFGAVRNDSRCPTDVACVWAGNAELEFLVGPTAGEGPAFQLVLNTSVEPRSGTALGLNLTVLELSPAPVSTRPTRNYRVKVRVERAALATSASPPGAAGG
jgi:hypothetical protein